MKKIDWINIDLDQLFSDYYQNRLNESMRLQFESKMITDSKLKESYASYKQSAILAESLGVRDLVSEVAQEQNQATPYQKRKNQGLIFITMSVAAALLILFFALKPTSNPTESLFDSYFKSYPNLYTTRQISNNLIMEQAMRSYQKGDYQAAIEKFESIEIKSDTLHLYLGTAYLAEGKLKGAKVEFEQVEGSIFEDTKIWYLALTSLRAKEIDKSVEYLSKLKESSPYGKISNELINQLASQ